MSTTDRERPGRPASGTGQAGSTRRRTSGLAELVETSPELAPIVKRARWLAQIEHRIRERAPEIGSAPFSVMTVQNDHLVLNTESPEWAARLKMLGPRLLAAAGPETTGRGERHDTAPTGPDDLSMQVRCHHLTVRVSPKPRPPAAPRREYRHKNDISASARRMIDHFADGITDPDLRASLKRLAERGPSDDGTER